MSPAFFRIEWNKRSEQRIIEVMMSKMIKEVFIFLTKFTEIQKQPPEVFCKKRCFDKFRNIHWKSPVSESLF